MKPVGLIYLVFVVLLVSAAACGPVGIPTATPVPTSPPSYKSATNLHVGNGLLPGPGCTPPQPKMEGVSSYCADPSKNQGGVTYSDWTNLTANGTYSWLVGDSIPAGVTCNLDNGSSTATCSGPPGMTIQGMICSSCSIPNAAGSNDWVCAQGFTLSGDHTSCISPDPQFYNHQTFCPAGSLWNNSLQQCVSETISKQVVVCPTGHPFYDPGTGRCYTQPQMVYDCQTFPVTLGFCVVLKPIQLEVVPFCLNNKTNEGAANITIPKGALLTVDIQKNHLDSCTLGQPRTDGSRVLTCLGPSAQSFGGTACSDPSNPATCQTVTETLGQCAGISHPSGGQPAAAPTKPPCKPSILGNCP